MIVNGIWNPDIMPLMALWRTIRQNSKICMLETLGTTKIFGNSNNLHDQENNDFEIMISIA